jgi:hypothetical protein
MLYMTPQNLNPKPQNLNPEPETRYAKHLLVPDTIVGFSHLLLLDALADTRPDTPSFSNFSNFVRVAFRHAVDVSFFLFLGFFF